jgi:type I restriction enzyme S subunit
VELTEIGFTPPNNWVITYLSNISPKITDGEHATPRRSESGYYLLSARNVTNEGISLSDVDFVPEDEFLRIRNRCNPDKDDILISCSGSVGRVAIVDEDNKYVMVRSAALVKLFHSNINNQYIAYALRSPYVQSQIIQKSKTTAQANLFLGKIKELLIPLPPLKEQKRIVAKVDQLMALCDALEERQKLKREAHISLNATCLHHLTTAPDEAEFTRHWQRIAQNFNQLYTTPQSVSQLRQAILQLAVQGKLVQQDPGEEPAEVLLNRIKDELLELKAKGKIAGYKTLPEIEYEKAPFDLPNGWAWSRFSELGEFGRGKSKHRPRNDPKLYINGSYPFVQTGDVARANGLIKTHTSQYNEVGLAQSKLWPAGTLCITIAANIADSGVLSYDACFPDSVVGFIPSGLISNVKYFDYFMRTAKERLSEYAPSTAQKNINLGILEEVYIPSPPLNEMKRIGDKVNKLMSLCDALEANLTQAEQASETLINAVVHHIAEGRLDSSAEEQSLALA